MIPGWVAKYVGLPYEDHGRSGSYDCWGLVKYALQDHFGIEVPDFGGLYVGGKDEVGIPRAFEIGKEEWFPVSAAKEGDVIIINIGGRPMHCGMVVAPGTMLHCRPVVGSCVEGYDRPQWTRRVEGIYRHRSRT